MPRKSGSLIWAFAGLLGLLVFFGHARESLASLDYRFRWEVSEDDDGRLLQLRDHSVNGALAQDLTDRLTAKENLRYNNTWVQKGQVKETLSPGFSLASRGDIFVVGLSLSGLRNLNSDSSQLDQDDLGLTWASSWKRRFVPNLWANYDYSRRFSHSDERQVDDDRWAYGGRIEWDLELAQLYYSYRHEVSQYKQYDNFEDSQLARINSSRSWFDRRLVVSLGHEYSQTVYERQVRLMSSTTATIPVVPIQALVSDGLPDPDPADTDDSMLNPAAYLLNDPDPLLPPAFSVVGGSVNNSIRLHTGNQQIDHLYLYTQANLGAAPLGLTWRVYSRNSLLVPWTLLNTIPAPAYDTANQRFVFTLPALNVTYLKIVVDSVFLAINFTEVRTDQVLHGSVGSTISDLNRATKNKTAVNLDYRIIKQLAFYYNLSFATATDSYGVDDETEIHNCGLRMQNSDGGLKSTLSYSQTRSRRFPDPELETAIYQLDVSKALLPTLSVALAASHDESSRGGTLLTDKNRYSLYADAKLYPDLYYRMDITYWEQQNYDAASGSGASDSLRGQFVLTSRFRPSLNVSLSDVYEEVNRDNLAATQKNNVALTATWQLSEVFSVTGSVQKEDSSTTEDSYAYTLNTIVGLVTDLQLRTEYSLRDGKDRTQSGLASLRWSSRNLSWETGCNYAESTAAEVPNDYKFYSKMSVHFGIR